jgi:hypothetical protein
VGSVGGSHGVSGGQSALANSVTPSGEVANVSPLDITLDGYSGPESDLSARLERLAQTLSSTDGADLGEVGTASAADAQTVGSAGSDASWLGAGALARAPRQDPLPKTYRCPACRKPLVYGHRFCGYCGEPLDKTLA